MFYKIFKVQQKAAEAKETADRARQQITESMEKLKELKNRLQEVGTNDVKGKDLIYFYVLISHFRKRKYFSSLKSCPNSYLWSEKRGRKS